MVIDTSALIAIFLGEPERRQFLDAITFQTRIVSNAKGIHAAHAKNTARSE
jgi:uncharacterized protein with PIN domain